jgi:hypothetical protein
VDGGLTTTTAWNQIILLDPTGPVPVAIRFGNSQPLRSQEPRPTGTGPVGKKRAFRSEPELVNKPDPTEAGSVGITQETAEPLRFSPAEPVDYL